ncbi:porin [Ascidiaceihabitans sp.]|uniref:porin n=1 Tax=Ascidiaceihabitans sp. TaxID=1872644 RepID=UPI003299316E
MKKVLFATTALVATAGVAAADVTFGGYGRFGILYTDTAAGDTTDITSRFRLQIDATAESDAGVTFGARVRIQQDNDGSADGTTTSGTASDADGDGDNDFRGRQETGINGVRFFARSGGLEVGVGNIFGALEFMPGMYPIDLGLTGHTYDYTAYNFRGDAYDSDTGGAAGLNGVEVMYSVGDFSMHVSASDTSDRLAAHFAYTFSGWTVALGLQDSDNAADTEWALSVGGSVGIADLSFAYAKNGDDNNLTTAAGNGDHWVLAARFDVGAATNIEAYVADADYFAETSYGVDFNHDLGGGTSLRGGISSDRNDVTRLDLGVRFNF